MAAPRKKNRPARAVQPASAPGMGAVVRDDCVSFRVWAPHAEKVSVVGDFNEWSKKPNPLANEGNGFWSTDVQGARSGQEYRYWLMYGKDELWRLDPYARSLTNSVGNSVIVDSVFDWEDGDFKMPPWNELVIYEMHLGTFHVKEKGKPGTFLTAIEKLDYLATSASMQSRSCRRRNFPAIFPGATTRRTFRRRGLVRRAGRR